MKRSFLLICMLAACMVASPAQATRQYVANTMKITLRTGPGTDNKIVALLKVDQPVTLLEAGDDWSKVQTPGGKEGWVLSRFLSAETPESILLEDLKKRHADLLAQFESLSLENQGLKSDAQKQSSGLSQAKETLEKVSKAYETLKHDSREFIQLQQDYQTTSKSLKEQKDKIADLEKKLSKLQIQNSIHWFLAGAGVLLTGLILGHIEKSKRRRSSLL